MRILRSCYCLPEMVVKFSLQVFLASAMLGGFGFSQTPKARQPSGWKLQVEGGKGEYWTNPVCHPLAYFSESPLLFDYEQDLYKKRPEDIRFLSDVKPVGVIAERKIVEIDQDTTVVADNENLMMKRLLVQRSGDEFCAIYQQLYGAEQVKVTPASIVIVSGEPVLKTMDQNGEHTWNEEYWTFNADGPIHVDLSAFRRTLSAVIPVGHSLFTTSSFDITGFCYKAILLDDGSITAKLQFENHRLIVAWKQWNPPGSVPPVCKE